MENQIETVKAFVAAINGHDLAALAGLMTEDHAFVDSRGTCHAGRATMLAGWREYFKMFPDYRIEVADIAQAGPLVAAFGRAVGTYNGRRGLIPENRIEMPAAWKALVQGGQIQTWQVYADWTEGTRIMGRDREGAVGPGLVD